MKSLTRLLPNLALLTGATVVTLLLVPVVFTLLVDISEFIKRHWKRAFAFART